MLTELVHGADAARNATHAPVEGRVAFTPQYQPELDWLRQQAQQHGIFSGKNTVQEKLNTPAGQAWLRMQYDHLAPPQGYLYDQYMTRNAPRLQQAIQDGIHKPTALPEYIQQDLPKYLTKQNSAAAVAAGRAWAKMAADFKPDYTPEQLENLGVYDALYRGQGPRLASLGEWKPEWVSEHDPKGWAQWYKRYAAGRRIPDEDERQIKRWASFKARHGGPFAKNPTPRRGWALRNWGIDPSKLVPAEQSGATTEMLDAYQRDAMQKYVAERAKQALAAATGPQPRVRVVMPYKNKYLMETLNNSKWPQNIGKRRFMGGGIEAGETPEQAAAREMYEELGVKINPKFFRPLGNDPREGWQHEHYLELLKHKLKPGNFNASVGSDAIVTLSHGLPDGDDYMGPDIKKLLQLQTKAAELNSDIQLQEHQQRISDRVTGEDPRMLVYHGLGSGKSLSAIAAAEAAKKLHGGNYGIVVPASLKGNFQKEIGKFTRNSNPEILSYTGLGSGKQFAQQPDTLIMDEAARLRNPNAAMTRAALQNAARAKRLMLLTGTPITNEPKDLASLISIVRNEHYDPAQFDKDFVGEKRVWPSFWGFLQGARAGVKPVMKNGPKLRSLLEGHVDYQPSKTPEGVDVNEETVNVPLSKEQQRIQKAIRTKIPPGFLWKLDKEFPLSRQELSKLNSFMTGLRQVSLSTQPFRADKDPLKAFQQSAKLQEAFKRLRENLDADPRKKAIIYSNFVDAGLGPYAAGLESNKVPYGVFHGGIPTQKRLQSLKDYNEGKLRALLIGPAGAEGISTKGTSLIQLLDPYWNESRLQQARGRGLRFDSHAGLPEDLKNVAVQRYLSTSDEPGLLGKLMGHRRQRTGDEVIQHMSSEKEQLNEQFRNLLREVGTKKKPAEKASALRSFIANLAQNNAAPA